MKEIAIRLLAPINLYPRITTFFQFCLYCSSVKVGARVLIADGSIVGQVTEILSV